MVFAKALQFIFFGELRLIETEVCQCADTSSLLPADLVLQRLRERVWYTVTESLLALTIFRDEFDTSFVLLFVSLLFVKVFHWLAADRVESVSLDLRTA